jgi:D-amino peptidase
MNPSKSRYFLSVDIEGITGVCADDFATRGAKSYGEGRRYMTHDVNAVIEGILESDPGAEIVVRDAHGSAMNLDLATLHPKASLLQGWGTSMNMMEGLDGSFRAALLVGYHAGGHNTRAVLSHTFLSLFASVRLNGSPLNETGLSALGAECFGLPVIFVSGDDEACREASEQLEGVRTVAVKRSLARNATLSLPLSEAGRLLREGAREAVRTRPAARLRQRPPFGVELELIASAYGPSLYENLRNVLGWDSAYAFEPERRLLRFEAPGPKELLQRFQLLVHLLAGIRYLSKDE